VPVSSIEEVVLPYELFRQVLDFAVSHEEEKKLYEMSVKLNVQDLNVVYSACMEIREEMLPVIHPGAFLLNKAELLQVSKFYF
jgi:hypothetical protein